MTSFPFNFTMLVVTFLFVLNYWATEIDSFSFIKNPINLQNRNSRHHSDSLNMVKAKKRSIIGEVEELFYEDELKRNRTGWKVGKTKDDSGKLQFPELDQAGIDEKALRASPFGKILFGVLDNLFPVFKEPNWFDVYDPPMTPEANMELPYFDGYDFVNSSWTIYIRHRFGAWNWLDRFGFVPAPTNRVFLRPDGKTMWNDGFYGEWYINPAINYFQLEKHYGRGYGYSQYHRGIRIFQVQRWNFEDECGRYWQRGLRSYLRNETNYWAIEGRIWGVAAK
jgi:hypothetical protein